MKRHFLLSMLLSAAHLPAPVGAQYDLIIRNAHVVAGNGNPWFLADVAVHSGRIAGIGDLSDSSAEMTVDARERVLSPGFIDIHTHVEKRRTGDIEQFPDAPNFQADGVTTIVTGNCGSSELDIAHWLAALETRGLGVNLATLVGHNSVRQRVMGTANRLASEEEIRQMESLVDQAMREGAVGLSTGLLYIPGTFADAREITALARVAARHRGVYATHLREQGAHLLEAIAEAAEVGRQASLPVQISHFKVKGRQRWGTITGALELIDDFRSQGIDVRLDAYPYDRSSTGLSTTLPRWALEGNNTRLRERLEDPVERQKIWKEMQELLAETGFEDYSYATVASYAPAPEFEGFDLRQVSVLRGRDGSLQAQMETILEMLARGGAQMIFHLMDERDVATVLRYPHTAVASDGGVCRSGLGKPHPRSYGTNARVLHQFVRLNRVLTLEEAVRRMTSLPAQTFRFVDRGMVEPGRAADLLLFDPAKVRDLATYDDPHQLSEGFDFVWVNGVAVVENGVPTGNRPGKVLRSRQGEAAAALPQNKEHVP